MARFSVGIDLGGTNIKAGLVDAEHNVLRRISVETRAHEGYVRVLGRLADVATQLMVASGLERSDLVGVGLGAPGPINHADGIILAAPNMPEWVDIPVRDDLHRELDLPVVLENDANAAAYGEFVAGAGRACRHMTLLTLGTGIGGGIIAEGRILVGHFGNAGEIGHLIVQPGGRACPCGQKGCLERYASAQAVAERYSEALAAESRPAPTGAADDLEITSQKVLRAAQQGDPIAAQVWDECCSYLALGCVAIQHLLNPQRIVLSGGLMNVGELLLGPVRRHFEATTWNAARDGPEILPASLGNDAGIIGAAALTRDSDPTAGQRVPG